MYKRIQNLQNQLLIFELRGKYFQEKEFRSFLSRIFLLLQNAQWLSRAHGAPVPNCGIQRSSPQCDRVSHSSLVLITVQYIFCFNKLISSLFSCRHSILLKPHIFGHTFLSSWNALVQFLARFFPLSQIKSQLPRKASCAHPSMK